MSKQPKKIIVILGPTSSGKSDIALTIAKKFGGEIISADSRQVYRGMDIGTGKVERDHRFREIPSASRDLDAKKEIFISQSIPHHMIDIVAPGTDYNVAKFKKQADKIIIDILHRGKLPIICGGTGFWIQSIVDDVNFPEVKPDWKLRKKLEKYPANKLFSMLKKLDVQRARNIDAKNKVRLVRAIEICKSIKKVPAIPDIKYQIPNTRYNLLQIGINLPKKKLYRNIEKRVQKRFKRGMIEEVRNLRVKNKLSWKKIQSFGLAYYWIPLFFQKNLSRKELVERVITAEKNYAKRQMTWFKRNRRIKWLTSCRTTERMVNNFLK